MWIWRNELSSWWLVAGGGRIESMGWRWRWQTKLDPSWDFSKWVRHQQAAQNVMMADDGSLLIDDGWMTTIMAERKVMDAMWDDARWHQESGSLIFSFWKDIVDRLTPPIYCFPPSIFHPHNIIIQLGTELRMNMSRRSISTRSEFEVHHP